jgi:hypothetical protein
MTVDNLSPGQIPAGYTYLGQFLDHDLTFDRARSWRASTSRRPFLCSRAHRASTWIRCTARGHRIRARRSSTSRTAST